MRAAFGGYLGQEMKSKAKEWAAETPNIKNLPKHKSGISHKDFKQGLKRKMSA